MGIKPENIVTIPTSRKISEALFDTIEVENDLNLSFVNNLNFIEILESRLLIESDTIQECRGIYYFDTAEINGETNSI